MHIIGVDKTFQNCNLLSYFPMNGQLRMYNCAAYLTAVCSIPVKWNQAYMPALGCDLLCARIAPLFLLMNNICVYVPSILSTRFKKRQLWVHIKVFMFYCFILNSYQYNMRVEGLMPVNLYLITILNSEQYSQCKRYAM